MATIDDLIAQVKDPVLRSRLDAEAKKLREKKKFGLVFEDHVPECTPLYEVPLKKGCKAAKRTGTIDKIYDVVAVHDGMADCVYQKGDETKEAVTLPCRDLVTVAQFGEPVYPYLQKLDQVVNAPGDPLWHIVMEAENFHALQLLAYLYPHKVDCCYIDPPFNTGARDWKYNNDYVDGQDQYRHSKWLSFMKHRLTLAKKLLNPKDSVLIVAIDEKEQARLGLLLEEMFPGAAVQMISTIINVKGVAKDTQFSRTNEFYYILQFGKCCVEKLRLGPEWLGNIKATGKNKIRLAGLMRTGTGARREDSPGCFYPIYFDDNDKFIRVGDVCELGKDRHDVQHATNEHPVWPLHSDGSEGRWMYRPDGLKDLIKKGYVFWSKRRGEKMGISYAPRGVQKKIEEGLFKVAGYNEDGSAILDDSEYSATFVPGSQWSIPSHNATEYGSKLLKSILGNRFTFPKSLYAVHDIIRFFMSNKKNSIVLDFFAGSGTTLHAVNLLNAEDGGKRRCIVVTNNEASSKEENELREHGYKPTDEKWESLGVARYVTWPRTVCSINGLDINGKPLKGTYLDSDIQMSDGFKTNACFYKLGYLNPEAVSYGWQFHEMIPMLWLKAEGEGPCPEVEEDDTRDFYVFEENHFAILRDVSGYSDLAAAIKSKDIRTVYIVTESLSEYQEDAAGLHRLGVKDTYQLYSDYLKNFSINTKGAER